MNNKKFALATEGRHLAYVTGAHSQPTKKDPTRQTACVRFSLYDERASATLWIGVGKDTEQLLASVPDHEGDDLNQLLGRTAEIDIVHGQGTDSATVYANVKPRTITWENEPTPPVENTDDPTRRTILLTATHPKLGTYTTATYFYRVIGNAKVCSKSVENCKSDFDAAKNGVFELLEHAKGKRTAIRVITDLQALKNAHDLKEPLAAARSSIQWLPGEELKRRLFRRLPRLDSQQKKSPAPAPLEPPIDTDADWIEALG